MTPLKNHVMELHVYWNLVKNTTRLNMPLQNFSNISKDFCEEIEMSFNNRIYELIFNNSYQDGLSETLLHADNELKSCSVQ